MFDIFLILLCCFIRSGNGAIIWLLSQWMMSLRFLDVFVIIVVRNLVSMFNLYDGNLLFRALITDKCENFTFFIFCCCSCSSVTYTSLCTLSGDSLHGLFSHWCVHGDFFLLLSLFCDSIRQVNSKKHLLPVNISLCFLLLLSICCCHTIYVTHTQCT